MFFFMRLMFLSARTEHEPASRRDQRGLLLRLDDLDRRLERRRWRVPADRRLFHDDVLVRRHRLVDVVLHGPGGGSVVQVQARGDAGAAPAEVRCESQEVRKPTLHAEDGVFAACCCLCCCPWRWLRCGVGGGGCG
jgi:hypothetical protein